MKITGSISPSLTASPRADAPVRKTHETAVNASEASSFRGIPAGELTPRVREAMIALVEEASSLRKELSGAQKRIRELEKLADTDSLLGIPNRRAFMRELNRALALVERYGAPTSLVFADLDNLKTINDTHGHAAGDAALSHVAKVISANIRQGDVLGRLGGDEFGVILVQADEATARAKAKSLTEAVQANPVEWKGGAFTADISYGVIEIRKGVSPEEAIDSADSAMYAAKKRG